MRTRTSDTQRREQELREKRLLAHTLIDRVPLETLERWLAWLEKQ